MTCRVSRTSRKSRITTKIGDHISHSSKKCTHIYLHFSPPKLTFLCLICISLHQNSHFLRKKYIFLHYKWCFLVKKSIFPHKIFAFSKKLLYLCTLIRILLFPKVTRRSPEGHPKVDRKLAIGQPFVNRRSSETITGSKNDLKTLTI